MKKLTLNKTWQLCLKQWKWIISQLDKNPDQNVDTLKDTWLDRHRSSWMAYGYPRSNCFFCEYNCQQKGYNCEYCPGKLVSNHFMCVSVAYNYSWEPRKFHKRILELDAKRKAK